MDQRTANLLPTIEKSVDLVLARLAQVPEQPPGLGWNHQDLNGACAVASWLLFKILRDQGIEADFCVSADEYHCFCMIHDTVVDPTARQFHHYPDVVIDTVESLSVLHRNSQQWFPWDVGQRLSSEAEIEEALTLWPDDQQPSYCISKGLI